MTCRSCGTPLIRQIVWFAADKDQREIWRAAGYNYVKRRGYCHHCHTAVERAAARVSHGSWALPGRWASRALCAQVGGDWWYPEGSCPAPQIETARSVCARCPVTTACLDYALANEDEDRWGVWGGTTPDERRQMLAEAS